MMRFRLTVTNFWKRFLDPRRGIATLVPFIFVFIEIF